MPLALIPDKMAINSSSPKAANEAREVAGGGGGGITVDDAPDVAEVVDAAATRFVGKPRRRLHDSHVEPFFVHRCAPSFAEVQRRWGTRWGIGWGTNQGIDAIYLVRSRRTPFDFFYVDRPTWNSLD